MKEDVDVARNYSVFFTRYWTYSDQPGQNCETGYRSGSERRNNYSKATWVTHIFVFLYV